MRHLLNTLFVNSEDIYLSLDGENVVASRGKQEMARYPLHILSGIVPSPTPPLRRRWGPVSRGMCLWRSARPGDGFSPGYPGNPPGMCCCGGHSTGQQMIPAPAAGSPAT